MILNHIRMTRESKSFTDAAYAILTAADRFEGPKFMLSGLSGMAFKFSVHRRLLPFSVTAYGQWGTEHSPAIDNLGIHTVYDGGRSRHASSGSYQQDAILWTKQSIDSGLGVIYWIPEFGVIYGYDDEAEVFYMQDGRNHAPQMLLYDNFGMNITPYWYCRIFGKQVNIPPADAVLESLRLALQDWNTPYKTLPDKDIASGRLAYRYLHDALVKREYEPWGAGYSLDTYMHSRREISDYLQEVKTLLPGLAEVQQLYQELSDRMSGEITAVLPSLYGNRQPEESKLTSLCTALVQAQALEERAMALCRLISERYPDRKRTLVPRWGAHTAR
ncbi:hypothetical protein C2I18_17545 [Paenibacillus sp. PK3_47]|uniref:hypothetical protein n=1 Tax=Paenibacillus sp. PK3_47 TaxID=2072642 RepID=UPI00201E58EB|nr:hypothetical protein [Paenibacillus sp. PK3_47]UQZ35170.1 hypothetical protein C2I18_17545 [Paenibacillus sp. PK3_47]